MEPQTRPNWVKAVRAVAWSHLPRNPRVVAGVWAVIVFAIGFMVLSAALAPVRYDLEAGQVAPEDIHATRTIVDRVATERARQAAAAEVSDQYEINSQTTADAEAVVAAVFAAIRELNSSQGSYSTRETGLIDAAGTYGITMDEAAVSAALSASPDVVDSLELRLRSVIENIMQAGVKAEYLDAAHAQAAARVNALDLTYGQEVLLNSIAQVVIVPNMHFNAHETQARREAAMAAVLPVEILKGQVIVRAGDLVTSDHLSILQDLGLLRDKPAWGALLGICLLVGLMEAGVGLYLYLFDHSLLLSVRRLSLLCLLVILTMALGAAVRSFSGYFIPVAAGTMLIAVLLDIRLAIFTAFVLGPFVGFMVGNDLRFALVAVAGGLTGVFAVSRLKQRSDLMRAGLLVAGANAVAIAAVSTLAGRSLFELATARDMLWGAGNGVASAILTIGSLPFLEDIFGVLTGVKLLELANPNQPLLRRLLMEAPGTYHHSIIVGNLAEAAISEVGGNAALARAGAYYHDIGKIKRPYFFVDNQFGGDNPHDKIAPSLSALIITSHVRDGVALAEEAGLPKEIVDLIRQHHGTSLVSYFYSRAAEGEDAEHVVEEDFRYDGPRPLTREAAVLMLADCCEAAARSLARPSPGRIEGLVRKIMKDRLDDGQLDESPLTLQDLDIMAGVFTRILSGIFHRRVEYPELSPRDARAPGARNGKNQNGRNGNGRNAGVGARPGNGRSSANRTGNDGNGRAGSEQGFTGRRAGG